MFYFMLSYGNCYILKQFYFYFRFSAETWITKKSELFIYQFPISEDLS